MHTRLRTLGIAMVFFGLFGFLVAGYTGFRTYEGIQALQAFSAAQGVKLNYNEDGQLIDRGETEGAQKIIDLVTKDWGYTLQQGELDPNDPLVNTASEYMYQMGTIAYHTLHSEVTITLTEDKEYNGEKFPAGEYTFANDGRYWTGFDRQHPIEGPARERIWTGTAHALIGELGVGSVTANTLQIGLGLVGVIGGLAGTLFVLGLGLIWVARAVKD
ncbi:MAG: hypothetical protein RL338_1501 [Chloroflexota bacterium]